MIGGADCVPACLAVTGGGWHRVAEHMPAAALYRATGQIGLVPSPGGFRTPSYLTDARFLAVDGTELAVSGAAGTKRTPVITVRAAAEFAGVTPGAPAGVHQPAAPLDLDAPLMIEPGAARLLAEWHGLGSRPEGAKTRRIARTRLNVTDARCEALFASGLQRSDTPDADRVAEVIGHAVRQLGTRGCAGRMAQEFGDHPEMAADRMRWVRQLAGEVAERTRTLLAWALHPAGLAP